ncbi:hypothetical protein OHR68_41795 [Spirillospora sp. NBC_00431]
MTAPAGSPDCPRCGRRGELFARCPDCGADLRPLLQVMALADEHFNAAVVQARARQWQNAAEHLAVARALSPMDVDVVVLLAKVRHRQGRRRAAEARALWQRALELDPDRADARAALESTDLAPKQRRRAPARRARRTGRGR